MFNCCCCQAIRNDPDASARVRRSYELMLDFYGIELEDPKTGRLRTADHWEARFRNLNKSVHMSSSLNYVYLSHITGPQVGRTCDVVKETILTN